MLGSRVPAPYTLPTPNAPWLPRARTRYLTRVARLMFEPSELSPWYTKAFEGVREPLQDLLKHRPAELLGALALPQIGAPLCAGRPDIAVPLLLLELSRRRVLGREGLWWSAAIDVLASAPDGRAAYFSPPLVGALYSDGDVEIAAGVSWDSAGEQAFCKMRHGGWLACVDTNPLASLEAHPDKNGNAVDLAGRTPAEWVAALDEARALISEVLPALAAEHASVLGQVVPVGFEPEKSLSASYREAIGTVYLTLHPKVGVMAEALIHEVQHNKLNLLSWSDPLIQDDGSLHVSPVRPDPRPLLGVLLAVHAFLPVAELHLALLTGGHPAGDPTRLAAVMRANRDGLEVLSAARPTAIGKELLDGMIALEAEQRARV